MSTAIETGAGPAHRQNGHVSQVGAPDLDDVSAFLRESFRAPPDAPFASREMLRWKYLDSRDCGLADAAFTLGAHGRIVAHAGLRTTTFRAPDGTRLALGTIIDWAADSTAPGAGIALYRHLMGQAPATYLLGGTPTTQAVAERLGFRRAGRARVHARWVRPLDEFLRRPKTARSALRLLHGVAHAPLDRLAPTGDWSLRPVAMFDDSVRGALAASFPGSAVADRSPAELNHRLRNPMSPARGYTLCRGDAVAGCALTSVGTWNARILAVHGHFSGESDLAAVFSLLTTDLARDPSVCRVSVLSAAPAQHNALTANGFWVNRVEPVLLHDASGRAAALGPIEVQYLDADLDDYSS